MKSETCNDAFQPVKLILESQAEVDAIFAVLNNVRVRRALELGSQDHQALIHIKNNDNAHRLHLKLVDLVTLSGDSKKVNPEPQWIYFINRFRPSRPYRISTAWTPEQPLQVIEDGSDVWINSSFLVREVTGDYADRFQKLDDLPIKSSLDLK